MPHLTPLGSQSGENNYRHFLGPWSRPIQYFSVFLGFPMNHILLSLAAFNYFAFFHNRKSSIAMFLYTLWIWFDRKRGNAKGYQPGFLFDWIKAWNKNSWFWKLCCAYYPIEVHKTAEIPNDGKKYMFVTHPHGIFGIATQGVFGVLGSHMDKLISPEICNRIRLVGLDAMFRIPFFREYIMLAGCVSSSRASFTRVFDRGDHICLNVSFFCQYMSSTYGNVLDAVFHHVGVFDPICEFHVHSVIKLFRIN